MCPQLKACIEQNKTGNSHEDQQPKEMTTCLCYCHHAYILSSGCGHTNPFVEQKNVDFSQSGIVCAHPQLPAFNLD